jgi:hypothetical protein
MLRRLASGVERLDASTARRGARPTAEIVVTRLGASAGVFGHGHGSAPFGLDSISWLVEGVPATSHERKLAGQVFDSATFDGVTLDQAGTFELAADARDRRFGNPLPGYPHAASQAGRSATAVLTVIERSEHDSR